MYICNSTAKIHIHTNVFTNKYTQKNIMYVSYIHTTNIIFIHFPQMPIHAMKCSHFICNRLGHLNCLQSCIACRERHSVGLCFFLYFLTFTARTYMYIQTYLYHTHIHLYFSFFMYFFLLSPFGVAVFSPTQTNFFYLRIYQNIGLHNYTF